MVLGTLEVFGDAGGVGAVLLQKTSLNDIHEIWCALGDDLADALKPGHDPDVGSEAGSSVRSHTHAWNVVACSS